MVRVIWLSKNKKDTNSHSIKNSNIEEQTNASTKKSTEWTELLDVIINKELKSNILANMKKIEFST